MKAKRETDTGAAALYHLKFKSRSQVSTDTVPNMSGSITKKCQLNDAQDIFNSGSSVTVKLSLIFEDFF